MMMVVIYDLCQWHRDSSSVKMIAWLIAHRCFCSLHFFKHLMSHQLRLSYILGILRINRQKPIIIIVGAHRYACHWLFPCIPIMQEDIKVYEDKLATLESISLLSRKEHMLPRGDDQYMYLFVVQNFGMDTYQTIYLFSAVSTKSILRFTQHMVVIMKAKKQLYLMVRWLQYAAVGALSYRRRYYYHLMSFCNFDLWYPFAT